MGAEIERGTMAGPSFVLPEGSKQEWQMASGRFWRKKKRCYSKVTIALNADKL